MSNVNSTSRDLLERAAHEVFSYVDYEIDGTAFDTGEIETLEIRSGLSSVQLADFNALVPGPLPMDVSDLLRFASGFTLGSFEVEFTAYNEWGHEFLLPHVVVLSDDGTGNSWAIEINHDNGDWRHIWFVCHDPPVMIYQCETLFEFINGVLDFSRLDKCLTGHRSILHNKEELCRAVWRDGNRSFPLASSLTTGNDLILNEFAALLQPATPIADFRQPALGVGFDWSTLNSGPTPVRRAGTELIFGLERPRGLLRRLFGVK